MKIVVGSGPAGVACARALLENGEEVLMLDVGLDLEPGRKRSVSKLQTAASQDEIGDEEGELIREMKRDMLATNSGGSMPKKLRYGSDYPYRKTEEALQITRENAGGSASLGKGGLSAVWGAQVLPFREEDLDDWVIDAKSLEPYYHATFEMTGLTAEEDSLTELFPLFYESPQNLERSEQAKTILGTMQDNSDRLNKRGIYFGHSRLALDSEGENGCSHCGLKIFGCCPKGSVYDSSQTLEKLIEFDDFQYVDDVLIQGVKENSRSAIASGEVFSTGEEVEYEGDKIFLACGAISTTKILLRSLDLYNDPVKMKETPYFILPLLMKDGATDVTNEDLNTLSQLFIEILDTDISKHTVHLQLYTYNDLYSEVIESNLGHLKTLVKPFMKPILNRAVVAMGYLHSNHGKGMEICLRKDNTLKITGNEGKQIQKDVKSVVRKLQKNIFSLGFLPLSLGTMIKEPGESFHIGGTFPMTQNPSTKETDSLGRPADYDRIHAVDSTTFPTIPATTITPSIMAMAYMIGNNHDE